MSTIFDFNTATKEEALYRIIELYGYDQVDQVESFVKTVYDTADSLGEDAPDLNLVFALGKMETDFGTNYNDNRTNNSLNILQSGLKDVDKKYGIPDEYKSWTKNEDGTKSRTYLLSDIPSDLAIKYAMQYMNIAKGYAGSYGNISKDGVSLQEIAAAYTEGAQGLSKGLKDKNKVLQNGMTGYGLIGRASYYIGDLTGAQPELTGDKTTDNQIILKSMGYKMPIDGIDGPITKKALNEYAISGGVLDDYNTVEDRLVDDFKSMGSIHPENTREKEFIANTQDMPEFPIGDLPTTLTPEPDRTNVPAVNASDTYIPEGYQQIDQTQPQEKPEKPTYYEGDNVEPIQRILAEQGYDLSVDGIGGPETLDKAKEFLRDRDYNGVDNINTIQDLFKNQEALDIIEAVGTLSKSTDEQEANKPFVYNEMKRASENMDVVTPEKPTVESKTPSSMLDQIRPNPADIQDPGPYKMKSKLDLVGAPVTDDQDPEADDLVMQRLSKVDGEGGDPGAALDFLGLSNITQAAEDTTNEAYTPFLETALGKSWLQGRATTSEYATNQLNKMPEWLRKANLFTTAMVEGALYNIDFVDTTGVDGSLSEGTKQIAQTIGSFGRSLGLMLISGGITEAGLSTAKALPWISKVSKVLNASKVGKVVAVGGKGALQGGVYSGLESILAPDSMKPSAYTSGLTTLEFSAGDVARLGANAFLNKFGINNFVRPLITSASDAVGGALAALAVHQDIDQTVQEVIAPQAVAMGAFEMIMWGISRGRLRNTPDIVKATDDLKASLDAYIDNPTDANQEVFTRQLNNTMEAAVPSNISDANANKFISDVVRDYESEQKILIDLQLFANNKEIYEGQQADKDLLDQLKSKERQSPDPKNVDDLIDQSVRPDKSFELYQDIKDSLGDVIDGNPEISSKLDRLNDYENRRIEKPEKVTSATPQLDKIQDNSGFIHTIEFEDSIDSGVFKFGEALYNNRLSKDIEDNWARKIQQDLILDDSGKAKKIAQDYYRYILESANGRDANIVFKPGSLKRNDIEDWVYYKDASVKDIDESKKYKDTIESKADTINKSNKVYNDSFTKRDDIPVTRSKSLEQIKQDVIDGFDLTSYERTKLQYMTKPSLGDSVNTTRLMTSSDTQELIKRISDKANAELPTKTLVNIDNKSQEFINDVGYTKEAARDLVRTLQDAPEILTALKKLQVNAGETIIKMAGDLRNKIKAGGEPTSLEYAQFAQQVKLLDSLTGDVKSINRNVAQTLNSGNINVNGQFKSLSELVESDLLNSIDGQNYIKGFDEGIDTKQLKKLISKLPEEVSDKLSDYLPQTKKAIKDSPLVKFMNAAIEWRTTNILSGLVTPLRNVTSQTANIVLDTAVDYVRAFTGKFQNNSDVMTFAEANSRLTGNLVGFVNSIFNPVVTRAEASGIIYGTKSLSPWKLMFMRFFQPSKYEQLLNATTTNTRASVEGMQKYFDSDYLNNGKVTKNPLASTMWKVLDYVGSQKRLISYGMLDITDRPFVEAAFQAELSGNITRMVGKGELSPDRAKDISRKVMNYKRATMMDKLINKKLNQDGIIGDAAKKKKVELLNEYIGENPYEYTDLELVKDLAYKSNKYSEYMTWKDPMSTSVFKAVERFSNTHRSFKFILPFFHTGGKLLEKWMYSSGMTSKVWRDVAGKNGVRAQNEAVGRLTVSGLMYVFAGALYATGKLTPVARDWEERQRMRDAGVLENAIKIGDSWISLNNIDPAPGMFFSVAASVIRGFNEADDNLPDKLVDSLGGFLLGVQNNLVNKSWMKSVSDFMDFMSGDGAANYMKSMLQSFDPNRPIYKNVEDMRYFGMNPFYEDKLMEFRSSFVEPKPRVDAFGKYITKYDQWMGNFKSEETDSPIRIELIRLKKTLQGFRDNLDGVKLTDEQHLKLQRSMETELHSEEKLSNLVDSSRYQNATDYEKEQMIDSLWRTLRNQARALMYKDQSFKEAYKENLRKTIDERKKEEELPLWLKNLRKSQGTKETQGTYQLGSWANKIIEGK